MGGDLCVSSEGAPGVVAPIPAVKSVVPANSPGSGPSTCAPATGTISDVCATPISFTREISTQTSWRLRCSARLREEMKSSFDDLYLTRTLLLFPAHEGFLRSMIDELLQLLL
jgi:hypothetical protein